MCTPSHDAFWGEREATRVQQDSDWKVRPPGEFLHRQEPAGRTRGRESQAHGHCHVRDQEASAGPSRPQGQQVSEECLNHGFPGSLGDRRNVGGGVDSC